MTRPFCLAWAVEKHGMVLDAAVALSNPVHVVATDQRGVYPDRLRGTSTAFMLGSSTPPAAVGSTSGTLLRAPALSCDLPHPDSTRGRALLSDPERLQDGDGIAIDDGQQNARRSVRTHALCSQFRSVPTPPVDSPLQVLLDGPNDRGHRVSLCLAPSTPRSSAFQRDAGAFDRSRRLR